ncbi:unnamed protein product, partial [Scytosiphon promiscuus]
GDNQKIVHRPDFVLSSLYDDFNRIGQEQFQILQHKGLDNECWRHAAVSIDADCATMTTGRKQRLAVQLSNCHLQDSGRETTSCTSEDSDEECVKAMSDNDVAFDSYSKFFHHVNAICHHLSQSIWQEQTEGLVRGLTASSLATFDRAGRSLQKQEQVLDGQEKASVQSQGIAEGLRDTSARLASLSDDLSQELESTMGQIKEQEAVLATLMATQALAATQASSFSTELGSAKSELASYMEAIEEDRRRAFLFWGRADHDDTFWREWQNVDLMETIGFIHSCLDNASSAWAKFQAFTYLILAVNLCWVLTTAPPLRSARTALFGLVAFGLLLEKSLCGDSSIADRPSPVSLNQVGWVVTGLRMASPGTFSADTWDMVVTQEKIRWLTFQAGAVILGHALVTSLFPSLQLWPLVGFLMAAWRNRNSTGDGSGAASSSPGHPSDCSGGNNPSGSGRAYPLRLRRGSNGSNDGPADGGRRDAGRSEGVREKEHLGGGQAAGGGSAEGGCAGVGGDGLDGLGRKELQSLAKNTNGAVRANMSSPNIVKGLRDLGITAES